MMKKHYTGQEDLVWCESCQMASMYMPATGHCKNPDYSGYEMCQECIDHYDQTDADGNWIEQGH